MIEDARRYHEPQMTALLAAFLVMFVVGAIAGSKVLLGLTTAGALFVGWNLYQYEQRWRAE